MQGAAGQRQTAQAPDSWPTPEAAAPEAGGGSTGLRGPVGRVLPVVAVVALTVWSFRPSLDNGFVNLDDYHYITRVRPLTWTAVGRCFAGFFEGYHPLSLVSLGVDYHFAEFNPWQYHAVNLALHVVNTGLVLALVSLLFRDRAAAWACALLFGLHPVHVEAVAWVTSRKDVLYSFFYLLALLAYVRHVRRPSLAAYAACLAAFVTSAFSKGMAVSFPLSMLCVDYALRARPLSRRSLAEKAPFLLAALAFGIVSVAAQRAGGYMPDLERMRPLGARVALAGHALWLYARNAAWPFELSAFCPFPRGAAATVGTGLAWAGLAVLGAATAWLHALGRRRPCFAVLFFTANVCLVLQVAPVANFIVANRYNYLGSIGVCLLGAHWWGVCRDRGPRLRWGASGALAGCALAFGLETRALCRTWRDGVSLWDDVLAKQPGAAFAWDMRGCAKNDLGQYTAAVADFDQAIRIAPAQPGPYLNRGFAKYRLDDLDGAIDDYAEALRLRPSDYLALNNRGLARMRKGEVRAALADFDLAVRASAGRLQAHLVFNNRSSARIRLGEFGAALADAREALRSKPNFAQAVANVGRAQRGLGNLSEATREFRRSLEMDQSDWNVWFDLADARLAAGATDEAVAAARAGVEAGGDPGRKALDQDSRLGPVRDALRTPAAHQTP